MDFPPDVVVFIERFFNQKEIQKVNQLLQTAEVSTPRVMRSVLYLSHGSLSLLKHFVSECALDMRNVVLQAEYVTNISKEPMFVRDMSLPFSDEYNLGEDCFSDYYRELRITRLRTIRGPGRVEAKTQPAHHAHLVKRKFQLGDAVYVVAKEQPHADCVRCHRTGNKVVTVARLPLTFVLEQVAEHIEAEAVF